MEGGVREGVQLKLKLGFTLPPGIFAEGALSDDTGRVWKSGVGCRNVGVYGRSCAAGGGLYVDGDGEVVADLEDILDVPFYLSL